MIQVLRQEILDKYNMSWSDIPDSTGLVQACKDKFEETLDKLIEECSNKSSFPLQSSVTLS